MQIKTGMRDLSGGLYLFIICEVKEMICPKCKKIYEDGNLYCVECGTRLRRERPSKNEETPIKRFSNRVKTSKPQIDEENVSEIPTKKAINELSTTDQKLDVLILQNKELINQNKRIIELLERLEG